MNSQGWLSLLLSVHGPCWWQAFLLPLHPCFLPMMSWMKNQPGLPSNDCRFQVPVYSSYGLELSKEAAQESLNDPSPLSKSIQKLVLRGLVWLGGFHDNSHTLSVLTSRNKSKEKFLWILLLFPQKMRAKSRSDYMMLDKLVVAHIRSSVSVLVIWLLFPELSYFCGMQNLLAKKESLCPWMLITIDLYTLPSIWKRRQATLTMKIPLKRWKWLRNLFLAYFRHQFSSVRMHVLCLICQHVSFL